ncbi:hypothetical protein Fot_06411 [Forsythia ovata]|uniref:Uncharacterized protein n=1 Tax=Forsythia ovata TaxID=205694 RepID=A0ABD1WSW4_9LAMI
MAWQKKPLVQYQNMLNNVKEKTMKPSFIFEGVKTSWQQLWSNPEHRRLSQSSMYFECNTRNPSTGPLSLATSTINNCIIKQLVERKREGYTTSDPRRLAFTDLLPLVA